MKGVIINYVPGKKIVFFPASYDFFVVKDDYAGIIEKIQSGLQKDEIISQTACSQDEYEELSETVAKNSIFEMKQFEDNISFSKDDSFIGKVVFSITDLCNLRCGYCYEKDMNISQSTLTTHIIDLAFENLLLTYSSIKSVQFFGGEPFLNVDICRYICEKFRSSVEKGILSEMPTFSANTNGTVYNDAVRDLCKEYSIHVTLSYDGDYFVNNITRPHADKSNTSEIFSNNVDKIQKDDIFINGIQSTYTSYHQKNNISIMDMVSHISKTFGVNNIHINPMIGSKINKLYCDSIDVFQSGISEIISNGNLPLPTYIAGMISSLRSKDSRPYICLAGLKELTIAPDGNVYPCFMLIGDEKYCFGNVSEKNIRTSPQFLKLLHAIGEKTRLKINKCSQCHLMNICSTCYGANLIETGDIFEPSEQFCKYRHKTFEASLCSLAQLQK